MGAQQSVAFLPEDAFLRHVDRKNRIRNDIVSPDVFKDKHETLSFFYQAESLRTDKALDEYQRDRQLMSGDLPGLVKLTYNDLTVSVEPPLPPVSEPDPDDEKYGNLHYCTAQPTDVQRRVMAHCAKLNGIVRPFIYKKHRKDL